MGKYRPPALLDPSLDTQAVARQPHALGSRARKLPQGILVVRFEMPFAIWCSTCPASSNNRLIGQGVRFNAEKKKVGNYFSTPVWSFRMKHTACGGWMEIRTDPKSTEYIVTEGAKRRDVGDDVAVAAREGATVLLDEKEKKRQDAFEALEGKSMEKFVVKNEGKRVEIIRSLRERDWRDTDASNRKLRASFRTDRKEREKNAAGAEQLQDKLSLGIEILAENESDRRRALLIDFGLSDTDEGSATRRPLFDKPTSVTVSGTRSGKGLRQELIDNTRITTDPFATSLNKGVAKSDLRLLTRPVSRQQSVNTTAKERCNQTTRRRVAPPMKQGHGILAQPLVAYDSD